MLETQNEEISERSFVLETLSLYVKEVAALDRDLEEAVNIARQHGCSWAEIGTALGRTHQAVIARYSKRVKRVDLRVKDHPRRQEVREQHGWSGADGER